jgi:hypothetical protein
MSNLPQIIIEQIKVILVSKGQNITKYTFKNCKWSIIVKKNNCKVTICYDSFKISCITENCKKWRRYLCKKLKQFTKHKTHCDNITILPQEVEERWIVNLKNDRSIDDINCPDSICVMHTYNMLAGFSCTGTKSKINELLKMNPHIESYSKDDKAEITVIKDSLILLRATNINQTVGRFITRMGVNHSSRKAGTKIPLVALNPNIFVFVVDTGITSTHPELNINTTFSKNFTSANPTDWTDYNGHGTHVSGIIGAIDNNIGIVGVAPGVNLVSIRVLDANGSGYYSQIIAALDYILQWKIANPTKKAIVNMSFGGPANNSFDNAVRRLINGNVIVVVAAGNESRNVNTTSPARISEAITVGAYNPTNNILASWSNFGSGVDILAPGVSIDSTYLANGYAILSGTSTASPMVVGAIACLMSTNNSLNTPLNIRNAIVNDAKAINVINYDGTNNTNPNISLYTRARAARTTTRSVYAGKY